MNEQPGLSQKGPADPRAALPERWHSVPLLLCTVVIGAVCVLLARPFFSALAWAAALAVVLAPAYRSFLRRLRSRNLAAGLTVVLVALVLSALAVALLPGLVQTALDGLDTMQAQIQAGAPAQILEQHPRLGAAWHWIEAKADLAQTLQQAVGYATALAASVVQGSLVGLLEACMVLLFLFYFLRDQELAVRRLRSLRPLTSSEADEFLAWQVDTL